MTESQFNQFAAEGYNRIPLVLETFADLDTPLSVTSSSPTGRTPTCSIIVGGGVSAVIRSSGSQPKPVSKCAATSAAIRARRVDAPHAGRRPAAVIQQYQSRFKAAAQPGLPRFCGGLVGYFGYDTVRYIERRLAGSHKPDRSARPISCCCCRRSSRSSTTCRASSRWWCMPTRVSATRIAQPEPARRIARKAARAGGDTGRCVGCFRAGGVRFRRSAYHAAVERAKRYIFDGDVMQVVPSQAHVQAFQGDAARAVSRAAHHQSVAVHVLL